MHQSKKGNQWHFGIKAHSGVDADSGLVRTVASIAANVSGITQGHALPHGEELIVFADARYQGANKRAEATGVDWQVALRPGNGKGKAQQHTPWRAVTEQVEKLKASVRAKVEHPFRVIKRQFGHTKVRYRGLKKNTAQLITLFALPNIWMARSRLLHWAQG
jgi:IS5 family transposase